MYSPQLEAIPVDGGAGTACFVFSFTLRVFQNADKGKLKIMNSAPSLGFPLSDPHPIHKVQCYCLHTAKNCKVYSSPLRYLADVQKTHFYQPEL